MAKNLSCIPSSATTFRRMERKRRANVYSISHGNRKGEAPRSPLAGDPAQLIDPDTVMKDHQEAYGLPFVWKICFHGTEPVYRCKGMPEPEDQDNECDRKRSIK